MKMNTDIRRLSSVVFKKNLVDLSDKQATTKNEQRILIRYDNNIYEISNEIVPYMHIICNMVQF